MIVTFHIEYRTSWGEEVRILGSVPELGKNNPEQAVALTTVDGIHWSNEISIAGRRGCRIQLSHIP